MFPDLLRICDLGCYCHVTGEDPTALLLGCLLVDFDRVEYVLVDFWLVLYLFASDADSMSSLSMPLPLPASDLVPNMRRTQPFLIARGWNSALPHRPGLEPYIKALAREPLQ